MARKGSLIDVRSRRALPAGEFEFRASETNPNSVHFEGYASVFGNGYDVYGGPTRGGWTETVDPHAFDVTLKSNPDVVFLVNHDGLPLARTRSGTLHLSADKHGLFVDTDLDTTDPHVQSLAVKMRRGDLDQMSFGFVTKSDYWSDDETKRTLLEVSLHQGDVSVVTFPANPATDAELNMLRALEYVSGLDEEKVLAEVRDLDLSPEQRRNLKARLVQVAQLADPPKKKTLSLAEALRITGA
jgi:HK97 family phage prohead protease